MVDDKEEADVPAGRADLRRDVAEPGFAAVPGREIDEGEDTSGHAKFSIFSSPRLRRGAGVRLGHGAEICLPLIRPFGPPSPRKRLRDLHK